jgi:hypothetical protein
MSVILGCVAGLALALLLIDWNQLKEPVTDLVQERTGRKLQIHGDLTADLSMTPLITVEGIAFANADWAGAGPMLTLERLRFSVRLWDLLKGRVVLPQLELYKPDLALEKTATGTANWQFNEGRQGPARPGDLPLIGKLRIENGSFRFIDGSRNFELDGRIRSASGSRADQVDDMVEISARGKLEQRPFDLDIEAGSLQDLSNEDEPYPVDIALAVADTQISVAGSLDRPLQPGGLDLTLQTTGPDLSRLSGLTGTPFPGTPPYRISAQLLNRGELWLFQDIHGEIGDSDIAGNVEIDASGDRLHVTADLNSQKLDFDDLGPLVGAPPGTGPGETGSAEQEQQAEAREASGKAIPDTSFDPGLLRLADGDIRFRASKIIAPELPLEDIEAQLVLDTGVLQVRPLRLGVADGVLEANIVLDATGDTIDWEYDISLRQLKLGRMVTAEAASDLAGGTIEGVIRLSTKGNSMHAAAGNSNGTVEATIAGGSLNALAIELIGLDIAESLGLLLDKDQETIPFTCALADLQVSSGKLRSQLLLVDTPDTRIEAELEASLKKETFRLTIHPQPKDASLFTTRSPLHVKGTFTDLKVRPDVGSLVTRFGAAAALSTVATPAAALLAFVEPGAGEKANCRQLREQLAAMNDKREEKTNGT